LVTAYITAGIRRSEQPPAKAGYYRSYCYLPLYIFCGEHLLCARLRKSDQDGAAGTVDELAPMVERIRLSWPRTRIIVRGDSGFCREDLMVWCEAHGIEYVLGVPKNSRLKAIIAEEMAQAKSQYEATATNTFALLTRHRIQSPSLHLFTKCRGLFCMTLRKSPEITRSIGHIGTKKHTSSRTQPVRRPSSGLCSTS
jgi:hypothetical protein